MAVWYEGNLNNAENRREENGVVYYIRGVRVVDGARYERYAVKTHFIERGESYLEVLRRYVVPLIQPGDIVTMGEKVISMCQNNTVEMKDVRVGFWARFLSKFATHNNNGIAMDEPYKLQLAIDMKGLPLILWASFAGAVCKLFGKRGVFYEMVGQEVSGLDGFYDHEFQEYGEFGIRIPENPGKVCDEIEAATGVQAMIVDANDLNVEILGKASSITLDDETLKGLIRDNPAGQSRELTPFILIREVKEEGETA